MLKVFLAEDESIIRETLRDSVPWEKHGYSFVGEAADGELALPLIRRTRPDVLITDIRMPFLDGLELSRLVLRELPDTKIVILSGYDDFEYARRAISIGVEQYLLKPVTKSGLLEVLDGIREKIEAERSQSTYLAKFHLEDQEYEQYARRRFFERAVSGQLDAQQIRGEAAQLELDLRAGPYSIVFFSVPPEPPMPDHGYSETLALARKSIFEYFLQRPEEYLFLRWNLNTFALLIKCGGESAGACVQRCVDAVRTHYESCVPEPEWYVAAGPAAPSLDGLRACFETVSRLWSYRYIVPAQHVLTADILSGLTGGDGGSRLRKLDITKVDPAILLGVMKTADAEEIDGFVSQYMDSVSEALEFPPFFHYLMLSARFTAVQYALTLGVSQEEFLPGLPELSLLGSISGVAELVTYIRDTLLAAVNLRERTSNSRSRGVLAQALRYIDENYAQENLSLNRVARQVNISANYLSAMFSQEMGCTLTEYITARRMDRAKEILRSTDKRSGEIAFEVGYHDPHYFSFLFKKTQGCTPRDYRSGKAAT